MEAKAARIKEWVTNKLRELEQQNQHLREQNIKCNQQLELLKNHLALADRRRSESGSPEPRQVSPECGDLFTFKFLNPFFKVSIVS